MRFVQMIAAVARPVANVRVRTIDCVDSFVSEIRLHLDAAFTRLCCAVAPPQRLVVLAWIPGSKRRTSDGSVLSAPGLVAVTVVGPARVVAA